MKKMKTSGFLALGVLIASCCSCTTQKKIAVQEQPVAGMPQAATAAPQATGDTDEYFEGWGIHYGSQVQMGELHILALANAQKVIRQKIIHCYEGIMEDYLKEKSDTLKRDLKTDLSIYGEHAINAVVGDTWEVGAPQFSAVDERGNVTCTVLARVKRKDVTARFASFLFHEGEMRKQLEEKFFRQLMDKYFENK